MKPWKKGEPFPDTRMSPADQEKLAKQFAAAMEKGQKDPEKYNHQDRWAGMKSVTTAKARPLPARKGKETPKEEKPKEKSKAESKDTEQLLRDLRSILDTK